MDDIIYINYLIESANDEAKLFEELLASDFQETKLLKENADEFQIRLLQESTAEKIWNAIKTAWKKFYEMLAKLFKTMAEKIKKLIYDIKAKFKKTNDKSASDNKSDSNDDKSASDNKKVEISVPDHDDSNSLDSLSAKMYDIAFEHERFFSILSEKVYTEEMWLTRFNIDCEFEDLGKYFQTKYIENPKKFVIETDSDIDKCAEYINRILLDIQYSNIQFSKKFEDNAKTIEKEIDELKVSSDDFSSDEVVNINASFNTYRKVVSKITSCIIHITNSWSASCTKAATELLKLKESINSSKN